MSMSFKTKITGEKIVLANIKKMEKKFPREFKKIVTKAVIKGESLAKQRVPVDTGRLRASITHTISGGVGGRNISFANKRTGSTESVQGIQAPISSGKNKTVGAFGTNVKYAKKVEENKPYLIPAWQKAIRLFVKLLNKDIKRLKP